MKGNRLEERVAIFIDGSNFYHGMKWHLKVTKVDFAKLAGILCDGRKLVRTYYYNAPMDDKRFPEKCKKQMDFFNKLRSIEYFELRLGRIEPRPIDVIPIVESELVGKFGAEEARKIIAIFRQNVNYIEKGVDINLATDVLRLAFNDAYDTAVIVTGDTDFECALKCVMDRGKHVEVAYFDNSLRNSCDKFIPLNESLLRPCIITY